MMEEKLLPCPFKCSDDYIQLIDESKDLDDYIIGAHCYVECDCGATGPRVDSKEEAVKAWNNRRRRVLIKPRAPRYDEIFYKGLEELNKL